jgi:hypothetical protein
MNTYLKLPSGYDVHTPNDRSGDFNENNINKQQLIDYPGHHVKKGTAASRLAARKRSVVKKLMDIKL